MGRSARRHRSSEPRGRPGRRPGRGSRSGRPRRRATRASASSACTSASVVRPGSPGRQRTISTPALVSRASGPAGGNQIASVGLELPLVSATSNGCSGVPSPSIWPDSGPLPTRRSARSDRASGPRSASAGASQAPIAAAGSAPLPTTSSSERRTLPGGLAQPSIDTIDASQGGAIGASRPISVSTVANPAASIAPPVGSASGTDVAPTTAARFGAEVAKRRPPVGDQRIVTPT